MKLSAEQHLQMASLLDSKAETNPDPAKAKKQLAIANVFRLLAQKASAQERDSAMQLGPMVDEPGISSLLDIWEQFLTEAKAMPESAQMAQIILHAEHMIALKKQELDSPPTNLPLFWGFIDEPSPFASPRDMGAVSDRNGTIV